MQAGRHWRFRRVTARSIGASGRRFPPFFDGGCELSRAATHVDACDGIFSDAGSTPAASNLRSLFRRRLPTVAFGEGGLSQSPYELRLASQKPSLAVQANPAVASAKAGCLSYSTSYGWQAKNLRSQVRRRLPTIAFGEGGPVRRTNLTGTIGKLPL